MPTGNCLLTTFCSCVIHVLFFQKSYRQFQQFRERGFHLVRNRLNVVVAE